MGVFQGTLAFFPFFIEDFSFLSVCWCAVVSSSRNFFKFPKNLFQSARIGLNNGFIHWNECDTKAKSLVRSGEKRGGKKSKIFSISLDIFAASCSEARKIGCYWPRVSCDWTLENCMLTRTHLYICDEDNWKSLKNQPCILLTCATRSTKRRHCMWAKIANKSLIMIDLRRTRLRKIMNTILHIVVSNLQYSKQSSARLSDVA